MTASRKKIALLSTSFLPTVAGTEIEMYQLALRLSEHYDVTVVLPSSYIARLKCQGFYTPFLMNPVPDRLIHLAFYANKLIGSWLGKIIGAYIFRNYIGNQYDFYLSYFIFPTYFVYGLSSVAYRTVLIPQGVDIQVDPKTSYGFCLNKNIENMTAIALKDCYATFYMGEAMQARLESLAPGQNYIFCPTATNHAKIESIQRTSGEIFSILSASRNDPKKNLTIIPTVVECLLDQGVDDFHWTIVGSGVKSLEFSTRALPFISLVDPISVSDGEYDFPPTGLARKYRSADLFIHPSVSEGMSLTILDVMASRTPLLVGAVPGIVELLPENGAHFTDIKNSIEVANTIISCMKDDASQRKEKTEAAYLASEKFSWESVLGVYRSVLEK